MSGLWRDFVEVPGHLLYFGDDAKFNHYMVSLLSPLQVTRLEAVLAKMVDLEASQDPYMLQVRPVSSVLLIILNPGLNLLEGRKI